jgi:putative transposase
MDTNATFCKYCQSSNTIRFGTRKGTQYHFCKDCRRKFVPDTLPKMKTPTKIIASALGQYYGGMPLDSIQRQLQQDYNLSMSEVGIYKWVVRFSQQAVKQAKTFKPKVGDVWLADETVLKVGGKNMWFWDLIDEKTRFLLASKLSYSRTTKDAEALMQQAYERAGKAPKTIVTDKLAAYLDGIERVFGADTQHIQTSPFGNDGDSTSIIERFHGTLKERTDIVRGFKNPVMAKLLTDAWLVHYNFFKEHTTLGDIPPAQKMGIPTPFEDWNGVLKTVQETRPRPISIERHIEPEQHPKRRRSSLPKRKPKPISQEVSRTR